MNNTTATPRDRIIAEIVLAVSASDLRRMLGDLELRERDASVRVRLSRISADVCLEIDKMSHPQFIDWRDALGLGMASALDAFGLNEHDAALDGPGRVSARIADPYPLRPAEPRRRDRRSPADEALSDLIAEKVVGKLAARAASKSSEELTKWKGRAGANEARAGRLAAIVDAWKAATETTRDSIRIWDRDLGNAIGDARDAAVLGVTEAEVQADHAAKLEAPTLAGVDLEAIWDAAVTTAAERRADALEAPKDGEVGPETLAALQRAGGVTFKGEDLAAIQRLLGTYCSPGRDGRRIALGTTWPELDYAIETLADAYKRATA